MEVYLNKLTADLLEVSRMIEENPKGAKDKLLEVAFDVSVLPDTAYAEPLTAAMNNLIAHRLGTVGLQLNKYPREKIGDEIDRGLVLRRLLEEKGFYLFTKE